jgi:DNA-binding CsgD family transcriptional regulator
MTAALQPTPFVDMLGINGVDGEGRGVSLAFPSRRIIRPPNDKLGRELAALSTHLARAAAMVLPRSIHLSPRVHGAATEAPPATLAGVGALGISALRELAVRSLSEHEPLSREQSLAAWRDVELRRLVKVDEFERAGRRYTIAIHPRSDTSRTAELTEREREAALLASEGLSNKLIADRMQVSVSTVGTLLSRAASKLGVASRVALVRARDQLARRP